MALDPSEIARQLDKVPGEQSGKLGGYEKPSFEGSNQVEVGGRAHLQRGGYVTENAPEQAYGGGMGGVQRGKITFEGSNEVQVCRLRHARCS